MIYLTKSLFSAATFEPTESAHGAEVNETQLVSLKHNFMHVKQHLGKVYVSSIKVLLRVSEKKMHFKALKHLKFYLIIFFFLNIFNFFLFNIFN